MDVNVGVRGDRTGVVVTDYNGLIRELRKVDPETLKWLRKENKQVARKVQQKVRGSIPNKPPLSGMKPKITTGIPGRLTWGTEKPARSVLIQTPRKTSNGKYRSIVRLAVMSPATVLADMAGRTGKYTGNKSRTRVYPYKRSPTGQRWHTLSPGMGENFVKNLNMRSKEGRASRYVWPAAERALPEAIATAEKIVNHAVDVVNSRMRKQ